MGRLLERVRDSLARWAREGAPPNSNENSNDCNDNSNNRNNSDNSSNRNNRHNCNNNSNDCNTSCNIILVTIILIHK